MRIFRTCAWMACLILLCALSVQAQNGDTKRTTNSTLLAQLQNAGVFDRTTRWDASGNWGGLHSLASNTLFGLSLNDNALGDTSSSEGPYGILGHMAWYEPGLRLIPFDAVETISFHQGLGFGTRIDPELFVNSLTGVVSAEIGLNTGAAHGFGNVPVGTVPTGAKWRAFRKSGNSGTISGNTDATLMTHDYDNHHKYVHNTGAGNSTFLDPGQTGELLWVGVTARRSGAVETGNDADTVLVLMVRRQRLRLSRTALKSPGHEYEDFCPDTLFYVPRDSNMSQLPPALAFSFLPTNPIGTNDIAEIGVDSLPRMTPDLDTVLFRATNSVNRLETELRTADLIPAFNDTTREEVWKTYTDVRVDSNTCFKLVITRGMLNALHNAATGAGSKWTDFDGLIVLPRVAPVLGETETRSPFARTYVSSIVTPLTLAHQRAILNNLPLAGGSTDERFSPDFTFRLDVSLQYVDSMDVDVDNIFIRTPNLRAMMREMYRDTLEAAATATIAKCSTRAATLGLTTTRILGLRSPEERGENVWWAQRYLAILLNGMTITETHYRPFDRFNHIAYPMGIGQPILPQWRTGSNQRLITWNEQALGRMKPQTPAPYLRNGKESGATFGLKFGVCRADGSIDNLACECDVGLTIYERQLLLDQYETGFNNLTSNFLELVRDWDSLQYSNPTSCDGNTRYLLPDWFTQLHRTEYFLYHNFIERGNRTALFGDTDWLEQVWLGAAKKTPAFRVPGSAINRVVRFDAFESQGRPSTAEEVRLRLNLPTLLASSGLVYYFGPGPVVVESGGTGPIDPGNTFGDVVNFLEAREAGATDSLIVAHSRGDEYGADYPVQPSVGDVRTYIEGGVTKQAEVKLPNMVRYKIDSTLSTPAKDTLIPLWIDTDLIIDNAVNATCSSPGYEHIPGGYDIVRRVDITTGLLRDSVPVGERIYFGARSVRNEIIEYMGQVARVCETIGGTNLRWRDVFSELDLGAWRGKGYQMFDMRDEVEYPSVNPLHAVISMNEVRTRHPNRTSNARSDYEVADSAFYDLTYLGRRSSPDVYGTYKTDEFWLGIQNRRTNPLYILPEAMREDTNAFFAFSSGVEFAALVANDSNHIGMYDQLGARAIMIPFKYVKAGEGPKLLHITEMGVDVLDSLPRSYASRTLIDTVVDAFANFEVLLRPGEGKLFRIRIMDASADAAVGNLAFNTQTKMVLAHEQAVDTTVVSGYAFTDKLRYHLVYMRERSTIEGHRVYYRRSQAYTQNELPNIAGVQWEAEIEIGNNTRVLPVNPAAIPVPAGTINQTGVGGLFETQPYTFNIDRDWTNDDNGAQNNDNATLRAFFPTITVSRKRSTLFSDTALPATSAAQYITIAYSLLVQSTNRPRELHIAEVQLLDTPSGITPALGMAHSLAITRLENLLNPEPTFTVDTMALWGTPANGSTCVLPPIAPTDDPPITVFHHDRVFTAWSVRHNIGITNGSKPCDGTTMFYGPPDYEVLNITQTGTQAQYPSLTPYSYATTSFPSPAATLVWQESDSVPSGDSIERHANIMYTRVYEATGPAAHTHAVPQSTLLHYVTWTFPPSDTLVPFDNGSIYRISQTATGVSSLYPTVVRGGMGDGPEGDGRTLGSRIRLYNEPSCDSSTAPRLFDFEYEYLAWQETLLGGSNSRVRRRYFLMDKETSAQGIGDTMRIWSMNTVSHAMQSCVAPVVALAAMRVDSQLFKLEDVDTLLYADPSYCRMSMTGNISDTSVYCSFGLHINNVDGLGLRGAVHWKTWQTGWPSTGPQVVQHAHRFAPFTGYESNFTRVSSFEPSGIEISRDFGQWPHVAHRAFNVPVRREELRRVQEADDTARIVFTNEFYLKPTAETIRDHRYSGYVYNGEVIGVRCEDADNRELHFNRERDDRFHGSAVLLRILSSPTIDLVSDPVEVSDDVEITVDNIGSLRNGVELRCEDVDAYGKHIGDTRVRLTLPSLTIANDLKDEQTTQRTTYRLTNGGSKLYRLRLSVPDGSIMNEMIILDAEVESKGKQGQHGTMNVIDLASGTMRSQTDAAKPLAYPNPASTEIRVVPPSRSAGSASLVVELIDQLGRSVKIWRGEYVSVVVLPIEDIPSGMYSIRTTWASGEQGSITVAIQR